MDGLRLNFGIQAMVPPTTTLCGGGGGGCLFRAAAASYGGSMVEKQVAHKKLQWGFSFPYNGLKSLWFRGGENKFDALNVDDDVVLSDGKNQENEGEGQNGNWVLKILDVRSLWKGENGKFDLKNVVGEVDGECKGCSFDDHDKEKSETVTLATPGGTCPEIPRNDHDDGIDGGDDDDEDDDKNVEKIEFDRNSFSRLLKRVSLTEARLYAQMSYLGDLAYSIPQIKPKHLLANHGLNFVTSSFEKKEQAIRAEKEKELAEHQSENGKISAEEEGLERKKAEQADKTDKKEKSSASAAYEIVASAASYLHTHTKSILPFTSSKSTQNEDLHERDNMSVRMSITTEEMASLVATTDSVTSVVAAKEEVKQAVADDLNSIRSSPCEWFICDEDQGSTRYFVIQGSESLSSWKANLLFEPIKFEGLDVPVHRGIYEAAKGIYEQMLPEVHAYVKLHGSRATFRFTGHSLGGSLSLLINLMLLIRGEVPASSLLPVITFGSPAVMCGGDYLLHKLGLPRCHLQSITMHRDIVPRAFSCNYPNHVAKILKAVNRNFRNHTCLNKQKLLYAPMGEFLILQPDEKISPNHELLPVGSGLYVFSYPVQDVKEAEKQIQAARCMFLNSPHPLEILSDRSAYGSSGSIKRDHVMRSYLRSLRNVISQELYHIRKLKREKRRKLWWPLVAPRGVNSSIIVGSPVVLGNTNRGQFNFYGTLQNGKESFKRFSRLVASQHMQLLVVLLFPAKLLVLGTFSLIKFP